MEGISGKKISTGQAPDKYRASTEKVADQIPTIYRGSTG